MDAPLTKEDVGTIVEEVAACADAGELERAWEAAVPLRARQVGDPTAARALVALVDARAFAMERRTEVVRCVFEAHAGDDAILGALGSVIAAAHDVRFLNGPPPRDPTLVGIGARLRARVAEVRGSDLEPGLLVGFASAARILGRAWDADAEAANRRLIELRPESWQAHYDLGLFYKVRGRFVEGLAANRRAAALGGDEDESVRWNLAICATGAREGAAALAVWKALGQVIEAGRFGLPEGRYPAVKVRLAQRPLAERSAGEDDPGLEESVWIERSSPCHGIVRSALFQDLGVDYGDVVLFDGAPITHQTYGERSVPVFPHLVTLERPGYRMLPFVGTQPHEGALAALSSSLPEDAVLYSHTEQFVILCAHCWESEDVDHGGHAKKEHHVVRGKLCIPPSVAPGALRDALDRAIAASAGVRVFVPELSRLLGDHGRAEVEARRTQMIGSA